MEPFEQLRTSDLVAFLAVQRTRSVTAASRELRVTASQVSKAIGRLEQRLRVRLLARGARGVSLTPAALALAPAVARAVESMRALQLVRGQTLRTLTMVAPTFLAGFIGPTIARALPQVRLRFMELAPAAMRANLGENAFEMALSLGSVTALPTAWTSERVGRLRFGLFASSALAREIGQRTLTPTQVRKRPFIVPLSGATNMPPVDDGCPLGRDRVVMHEAQTILNAMELAAGLDAVVFGPVIAARRFVDAKDLVELDVRGWDVSTDLYLLTSADRVLERTRKSVRDAVSSIPELD